MAEGRRTIHALGKRVREAYGDGTGKVAEEDLQKLQDYRLTFRDSIAKVFKILYETGKQVDSSCIVTYRIKRINSIIEKLKRFPETPLDQLIDVAGCRCIVDSTEKVYQIAERLNANGLLAIKRTKDYIAQPQAEGYRSLHMYAWLTNGDDKPVEIQIRSVEHHDWATLVEISDVIIPGAKLKEYNRPKDLLEFHRILSLPEEALTEAERRTYFEVLSKYDYIDNLQKVFLQNMRIRYQWTNTAGSSIKNFYLIEVGKNLQTRINSFRTFKEAEDAYFGRFLQDPNANLVLTQIPNVSFGQLSMAYSNYVLSTHAFTSDCLNRYVKEIFQAMADKDYELYHFALDSYLNVIANQLIRIDREMAVLKQEQTQNKNAKTREWQVDLNAQITQLRNRMKKLEEMEVSDKMAKAGWLTRLRFAYCKKQLLQKYNQKVSEAVRGL